VDGCSVVNHPIGGREGVAKARMRGERQGRGSDTEPLGGEGDNKVSIVREAIAPLGKTSDLCAW
jgi:hypothetical protein